MTSTVRVGFGRQDITPQEPVLLNESHWCGLSKGVHSPLFARSVAFSDSKSLAVLVSCDVIAFPTEVSHAIREAIANACGTSCELVMLAATQNHASPKTIPAEEGDTKGFDSPALQNWFRELKEGIVGSAQEAAAGLAPARFGYGQGQAPGIAGNRRPLRPDGRAVMTWYRPAAESIAVPGAEDPTVRVIKLEYVEHGTPAGVLMNFSCHPNTLWTTALIASDFPGRACGLVESRASGPAAAVYFTGCCGNIDPFKYMRVPMNAFTAPGAFEPGAPVHLCLDESERFGKLIAEGSLRVLAGLGTKTLSGPVRSCIRSFRGPLRQGMSFDEQVEIQAIGLGGDVAFVGVPGEPFLEIEQRIRSKSPFKATFVCGQANGFSGYMPTREAYGQGGYEVGNSWTKFGPGIGELVEQTALEALRGLRAGE